MFQEFAPSETDRIGPGSMTRIRIDIRSVRNFRSGGGGGTDGMDLDMASIGLTGQEPERNSHRE